MNTASLRALRGLLLFLLLSNPSARAGWEAAELGLFEGQSDIGEPLKAGSVHHEPGRRSYLVSGGGGNMWFTNDAFHFIWKRMSGDLALAADVEWPKPSGQPHRKACLLIRQSLDPDSAYADAVLHGDGLASLQYRESRGAPTREIQSSISAPRRLRIEKHGGYVAMSVARAGEALQSAGGSFKIGFTEPFLVGLAVCAHDNAVLEQAVFANVSIDRPEANAGRAPFLESTLETVDIFSKDRRVIYHTSDHIEAPNWSPDGQFFLFNSQGRIYRLPAAGGEPAAVDTGFATRCNNDHGLSPDGRFLAISDQSQKGTSLIYILPSTGGIPRRVTPLGPSYWHGWSPDGQTLVYCAERKGEFDVYAIPASGGDETRLTATAGLDDGPEFRPDGKQIYLNSDRTGTMQIWRMAPDGRQPVQLTSDAYNNWFPHPSPDGKWLVFMSYDREVQGHPANKDVLLRLMALEGGEIQVLARLFGGQGTINVPSWSPDSRRVAFVSYQLKIRWPENGPGVAPRSGS